MSNNISFTGRLGKDPELKTVGQGQLLSFLVANDVGWGEKKTTNWMRCSVWGKKAETLSQYLKKGSQVFVSGELTLREWEKDGKKGMSPEVNVTFVDFIGGKSDNQQSSTPNEPGYPEPPSTLGPDSTTEMPF